MKDFFSKIKDFEMHERLKYERETIMLLGGKMGEYVWSQGREEFLKTQAGWTIMKRIDTLILELILLCIKRHDKRLKM